MSKPKQEQRFEKVVEWKQKPNSEGIFAGIIGTILFFLIGFFAERNYTLGLVSGIFIIIFITIILLSLGEGRKVYWRRIK